MNSLVSKIANNLQEAKNQFGSNNVIQSKEMTKAMAEVQSRVILAKQFPRDISLVESRIQASCERKSLAEVAEYEYPRGGTKVVGASIKLLEVVAQCYGNVQYGWDCMTRDMENNISHCKAFAWDVENNNYYELKFDVPHIREKKNGNEILTNPRDIYELEANQASRRVRRCLESIVPRDLVEQARLWCNTTLTTQFDVQKGINDGLEYFKEKYGVTQKQWEKYFGMSRQGFNKNQYLQMKKLLNSVREGLVSIEELFPSEASEQTIVEEPVKEVVEPNNTPQQKQSNDFDLNTLFGN